MFFLDVRMTRKHLHSTVLFGMSISVFSISVSVFNLSFHPLVTLLVKEQQSIPDSPGSVDCITDFKFSQDISLPKWLEPS